MIIHYQVSLKDTPEVLLYRFLFPLAVPRYSTSTPEVGKRREHHPRTWCITIQHHPGLPYRRELMEATGEHDEAADAAKLLSAMEDYSPVVNLSNSIIL